ncbi:MAG: hypothetical protein ACFFCV_07110 [Promethearchaeota archaeon]
MIRLQILSISNGFEDIFDRLLNFFVIFNTLMETLFPLLKYILIFMLYAIGYLTLRRYRGFSRGLKMKEYDMEEEQKLHLEKLKETHIILGIFYLALATGFLLGYLIHVFKFILDPIPDAFVYDFLNFARIIPKDLMARIQDPTLAILPYEKTIFYCFALSSFTGFAGIIMGLRFMIMYANKTHTTSFKLFIAGIIDCLLFGFTTFMKCFI